MTTVNAGSVKNSDLKRYYSENAWETYWLNDIDENLIPRDDSYRVRLFSTLDLIQGAPKTALVVGTGLGLYEFALCRQHPELRIWSFDISARQIECARNLAAQFGLADRIQFFCADAERIPLEGTFDLILCTEVLEHFADPTPVLSQVFSHAHQDTQIIISVPQNYQGGQRGIFYRSVGPDGQVLGESNDPNSLKQDGDILWYFHDQYDLPRIRKVLREQGGEVDAWTSTRFMEWLNHSDGLTTLGMGVIARWLFQRQMISERVANQITRHRHAEHLIVRAKKSRLSQ